VTSSDRFLHAYLVHRARLVDYASKIMGERASGEDLVQEAYLRLKALPPDLQVEEPFFYLRRIVRNLAIDALRRSSKQSASLNADEDIEAVAEDLPSAERNLIGRQEVDIVLRAMNQLPERTRLALQLYRFEGLKLAEIAARLGISVTLTHKLVHDGMEHCRRQLLGKSE
jgi:RNA polymerase sigma factor (sigma-70 family)